MRRALIAALGTAASVFSQTAPSADIETRWGVVRLSSIKLWGTSGLPIFEAEVDNSTSSDWDAINARLIGNSSCGPLDFAFTPVFIIKAGEKKKGLDVVTDLHNFGKDCKLTSVIGITLSKDTSKKTKELEEKAQALEDAAEALAVSKRRVLISGYQEPFIASDQKCAIQFRQAMAMDGIEKRQRLADLIKYQCGQLGGEGDHIDELRGAGPFVRVMLHESGLIGWVPRSWVRPPARTSTR